MKPLDFGGVTVDRVVEFEGPFFDLSFFPDATAGLIAAEDAWLKPHSLGEHGELIGSIHSYVVRTPHHVVLVDTCMGNDKRRSNPKWSNMQTPWLRGLRAIGVEREDVDFVLCTHLHVDHIGWNTQLSNGRWAPTFPNARYLFNKPEFEAFERLRNHPGIDGSFDDSLLPVLDAGQVQWVETDHAIDDFLWLEPSPGHTPGHLSLNLKAPGGQALFCGDAIHHPVQIAYPEWNSAVCWTPTLSHATRRGIVERLADTSTVLLPAHFATPTAGRIISHGARWRFDPSEIPLP